MAVPRAVPERAAVGHGPRGLQPRRRRLVVLQPRPGPLAGLPLGRGRAGRDQRRAPAAVLRAGAVERAGPDPQGAPLRADQRARATTARTSRSTTSTSTTCRPTRTSAGCTSTRTPRTRTPTWWRRTPGARAHEMEYELLDTGVFDDDRYFDVEVDLRQGRGGRPRLPDHRHQPRARRRTDPPPADAVVPQHVVVPPAHGAPVAAPRRRRRARRAGRPPRARHVAPPRQPTARRCCSATTSPTPPGCGRSDDSPPYPKDGIADHVLHGTPTVNPAGEGTKVAAPRAPRRAGGRVGGDVAPPDPDSRPARASRSPTPRRSSLPGWPTPTSSTRRSRRPPSSADAASVMRQALAGMLWSKQSYYFDLDVWLQEHNAHPLRQPQRRGTRNEAWFHMVNHDVISMPDKWEYPWYAAWDLAFHCIPLAMVDPDFAKSQLDLMLSQVYLHPSGQIPAYEWNFGDVNPPVHAFATLFMQLRRRLPRRRRPAVPAPVVHAAAAQLHLVGQPQGPRRQERLRGRLPRARQHRRVRPQRPAADGWPAGAGRRHGLDGAVQPEHARAGARPHRRRSRLRRVRAEVRRALLLDRRRGRPDRRPSRRDVGRRGRLLLRRAAAPGRDR